MTESPPIDLMWATLAACNGDRVEMSQAIDLLIECGETALADTLRWMMKTGKRPTKEKFYNDWNWWLDLELRERDELPSDVWIKLSPSKSGLSPIHKVRANESVMDYATFPDAVNALRVALVANKIIQEVTT